MSRTRAAAQRRHAATGASALFGRGVRPGRLERFAGTPLATRQESRERGMFAAVDWGALFTPDRPLLETFVRGTVMYLGLLLLLRVTPNHETGSASPTGLLVVVLIADAAQNAMAGEYRSITDGLLLVGTLLVWSMAIGWLGLRVPAVRWLLMSPPVPLVRNGRVLTANLRGQLMSRDDLQSKLRQQGVEDVEQVKEARLESDGEVSVVKLR